MDFIEVIESKKLGKKLTDEQIDLFARAAASKDAKDYQLAALLMAIRLNGMDARETASLTISMARTGDMLKPDVGGIPVDKHSTGGVGDTTTLVLVPLVAACGGKVIKMSGRGLGHTGGTIDKMESIPGMRVELPEEEFIAIARRVGCCVVGQTSELVPADKRLYALRDVTATVDSIPLIASSIMSKKLAGGAQGIVLDVKVGSGAIMKTVEQCIALSQMMVDIGVRSGRDVVALITHMYEPLGSHVGNALEVREAIDVLSGRTSGPLLEVSLLLGEQMLILSRLADDAASARAMLLKKLEDGSGLAKLREMIQAQGGDGRVCDNLSLLPQAQAQMPVLSRADGHISAVDAETVGRAAQSLGAGRRTKEDIIDPAVGLVMPKRIGDFVCRGETVATLFVNDPKNAKTAADLVLGAITLSDGPVKTAQLLFAQVTKDRTVTYT